MKMLENLKNDLKKEANAEKAKILQKFFKTGKGEYGYGDIFLGVMVPESRKIAKKYTNLSFEEIEKLLISKIHEERLIALLILVENFSEGDKQQREKVFDFYIKNTQRINNWDLVDLSAPKIVGEYLSDRPKGVLYKLVRSRNLWEKRISIISTFKFIKNGSFSDTFKISEILSKDEHDLIHKAIGWMLREVGKKDESAEKAFLKKHYKSLSRTTLRYAIERFPESERKKYLSSKVV